jgi:exosortase/archaeosortase family protein
MLPPTDPPKIVGSHTAFEYTFFGLLLLYVLTIYLYTQRKYTEKHFFQKKFILRLAAFLSLGLALVQILPTYSLQKIISTLSSSTLTIFGIVSYAVGENLFVSVKEGGYYLILVGPLCVGWGALSNYIALIFSVPDIQIRTRFKGILYGLPFVLFFNFLRVPLEGLIAHYYGTQPWIPHSDVFFANELMIVVYLLWASWLKKTL